MKLPLLVILAVFLVGACTAPPEDATRAQVTATTQPVMDDTPDNVMEGPSPGDMNDDHADDSMMDDSSDDDMIKTPDSVPITMATSTFTFEGFGPGKSHLGTFDSWNGELYVEDGKIVGGEGTIDATTVNTGIGGLDNHLKSADFFEVETYSTIEFTSTSLEEGMLTGDLTFHGTTNSLSFPVEVTDNSISADFVIDTSLWGMSNPKANDEVRIAFMFAK